VATASPTAPPALDLTIVSDETQHRLDGLCEVLALRGLRAEIVRPAAFASRGGASVPYIRRLDPGLANPGYLARVVARLAGRAESINTPQSVRSAEWLPLTSDAFRAHDVPQPRRLWCVSSRDVKRAARDLGFPLIVEDLVSHRRAFAETQSELRAAVAAVQTEPGHARGVLLERSSANAVATVAVLIVGGRPTGLRCTRGSDLSQARIGQIQDIAVRAVDAVGGSIMAAIVVADRRGRAVVRRVDAAPEFALFGCASTEAVARAITHRLLRNGRASSAVRSSSAGRA
jgi:hypothetical protein